MPACGGPERDAAGFVLAGGQSTRMGTDKALLNLGGRTLIAHAAGILAAAGLPPHIAGAAVRTREELAAYAPVVPDSEAGLGPLSGVCAALASTAADFGVFTAVDVPFLPPSLIVYLLRRARVSSAAVTLVVVNGYPQTFPVVLSRKTLPVLENELRHRRLGCLTAFHAAARELGEPVAAIAAEVLVQSGQVRHPEALPVAHWFLNFNTPQDVRLVLPGGIRSSGLLA